MLISYEYKTICIDAELVYVWFIKIIIYEYNNFFKSIVVKSLLVLKYELHKIYKDMYVNLLKCN